MRMQAYRLSLSIGTADDEGRCRRSWRNSSAASSCCATATPSVRCSCPGTTPSGRISRWSSATGRGFANGLAAAAIRVAWRRCAPTPRRSPRDIDALVAAIETHMSRWTALLHLLQVAMMTLAVLGSRGAALHRLPVRAGARRPVEGSHRAHPARRFRRPGASAITSDEFGTLAQGLQRHGGTSAVDVPEPRSARSPKRPPSCRKSASAWKRSTT